MANKTTEDLLEDIKRLLVLGLIKSDVTNKDIAKALDVNPSVVTRLVSPRKN